MNTLVMTVLVTIAGEVHTVAIKETLRMQRGKLSGQEIADNMRKAWDKLAAKGIFLTEDDVEGIKAEAEANRTRNAPKPLGEPRPAEEPPPAA